MKNIELKELYWNSNTDKRKEIKNILYSRKGKNYRTNTGGVDLLIYIVDKHSEDDLEVAIVINGIFTLKELRDRNININ